MKNIFKSLMFVAVAAMTFTACTKENNEVNAVKKGTTLTITADLAADDTRVAFGEADANGVRKTLWEAGDKVTFVVYRDNSIFTYVNDLEVAEAGATANFTVEFPETLQTGDRIEALVGQYVAESWGWYYLNNYEYDQYPTDGGLSTVYVKAVAEYDGNDVVSLTFEHQYPYGKMTTDYAVKFNQVRFEFTGINEYDYESTMSVTIFPDSITGNDYWFYTNGELSDITKISISAYDSNNTEYAFTKDIDASVDFKFVVGEISAFTVNDFGKVIGTPYVQATDVTVDSIKFEWDEVANATGYNVKVTYQENWEDKIVIEDSIEEATFTATGLKALTEYKIEVVATTTVEGYCNSHAAYHTVSTLADQSALDAEFTDAATFNVMTKLANYANTYLFTTTGGGTTKSDKFMYLSFNKAIDFTVDGEYGFDDINFTSGQTVFWLGDAMSTYSGWSSAQSYYSFAFTPYHLYDNGSDVCLIYVDANDNGTVTVTVYGTNPVWWSDVKFKGSFTGTITE